MFDKWEGEMAFVKINNNVVWTKNGESNDSSPKAMDICGNKYPDPKFAMLLLFSTLNIFSPIDITIPHTEETVQVTFGTTLNKHPCLASFGIDDVMIFVK